METVGNRASPQVRKSSSGDGSRITSIVNENYNPDAITAEVTDGSTTTSSSPKVRQQDTMVVHSHNSIETRKKAGDASSKSEDVTTALVEPQYKVDTVIEEIPFDNDKNGTMNRSKVIFEDARNDKELQLSPDGAGDELLKKIDENQLKTIDKVFKNKLEDSSNSSSIEVIEDLSKNKGVVVERRSVDMEDTLREIMDELQGPNEEINIISIPEEDESKNLVHGSGKTGENEPVKVKVSLLSAMKDEITYEQEPCEKEVSDKSDVLDIDNLEGITKKSELESNFKDTLENAASEETDNVPSTKDEITSEQEQIEKNIQDKVDSEANEILVRNINVQDKVKESLDGSIDPNNKLNDNKYQTAVEVNTIEMTNSSDLKDFNEENSDQNKDQKLSLLNVMKKEMEVDHDSFPPSETQEEQKVESTEVREKVKSQKFVTSFRNSKY